MRDQLLWRPKWTVEKFHEGELEPYDQIAVEGNLIMYGGAASIWDLVTGGEFGAGAAIAAFNAANSFIGVGNGTTSEDATVNDLQGASKHRELMDATYPLNPGTAWTSGASSDPENADCVWRSSFESADANFAWNEVALFNDAAAGQMLNRRVFSFGTKVSGDVWTVELTLGLG